MEKNQTHTAPRDHSRALVAKMLDERQRVLVLLWKVSGLAPFASNPPGIPLVNEFCQIMVDYVASAHFALYRRLSEGTERRHAVVDVAREIYPAIDCSTQLALAFNDKYSEIGPGSDLAGLHRDLSELGEVLAGRIELEDRLITALLGVPFSAPGSAG
jgi:regulator of sigma D